MRSTDISETKRTNRKPRLRESDLAGAVEHFLQILRMRNTLVWRRIQTTGIPIPAGKGLFRLAPNPARGMSDYILGVQGDVVFLELKRPGGKQRPGQREFEQEFTEIGKCKYWLIDDVQELARKLEADYCIKCWAFPA